MSTTDNPRDPRLTRGVNDQPVDQAETYLVLSDEERAKGMVRPIFRTYVHAKDLGGCGAATTMGAAIAETYARQPDFYGATYCTGCRMHRPVGEHGEFRWDVLPADRARGRRRPDGEAATSDRRVDPEGSARGHDPEGRVVSTPVTATVPTWCTTCHHPAPAGPCPRCGTTKTTTARPEHLWGDPSVVRRHGTELYDVLAFEILAEALEPA